MAIKGDFLAHVRETVTILRPMPSVVPRGVLSPRTQQPTRSVRLSEEQLSAIDKAAELLGVTRSVMLSWSAYQVALDILKQHEEFEQKK